MIRSNSVRMIDVRQHWTCFTYDKFSDEPPHFIDLNLDDNKFSLYRKHTFTGQYTHFDSFVPWKHRIGWIRSLLSRIHKICSPTKLSKELQFLKKIASWNGYPKHFVSLLIKRFKQPQSTSNENNNETETNDNRPILWLEMPYIGTKGEQLPRGFKKKLLRCLNVNVQIKTRIATTKLNLFTNTKDKVPKQSKPNVVYEFTCPKCNSSCREKSYHICWKLSSRNTNFGIRYYKYVTSVHDTDRYRPITNRLKAI